MEPQSSIETLMEIPQCPLKVNLLDPTASIMSSSAMLPVYRLWLLVISIPMKKALKVLFMITPCRVTNLIRTPSRTRMRAQLRLHVLKKMETEKLNS